MEKRARPAQNACSITIIGQICPILRKINLRAAGLAVVPPSMCECHKGEPTPQANHHVVDLGAHTQISAGMGGIGGGGASKHINMIEIGQEQKAPPKAKGKPKQTTTNQSEEHPQHKRKQVRTKHKAQKKERRKLKSTTQGIWTSETYGRRTHGRDPALIPTGSLRFTRTD